MSDLHTRPTVETELPSAGVEIFGTKNTGGSGLPATVWGVAALIVLAVVGMLVFTSKKASVPSNTIQPPDAYAASLPMSQLAMSESSSLSAVELTYLDGHIRDAGDRGVTGATVQVVFGNDEGLTPQIVTLPLTLIRMREPYIDTESMGAEPLKPGDDREFRLIFEKVPENWNTQMPEIRIVHADLK